MAPNYPIGSVDRALRLLLFVSEQRSIRLSDAATMLEVSQSGAHRLMDMLKLHGLVEQDEATKEYRAGPALVDIGLAAIKNFDLRREARPYLERLGAELEETVHLMVRRDRDSLFIDVYEPPSRALRSSSRVGVKLPAHATSGGKALLATLPPEALADLYPDGSLPPLTERTVPDLATLALELEKVRSRGYAVNLGESEADIGGVAVALEDRLGEWRGALAVTAPLTRLTDDAVERFGARLVAIAAEWKSSVPSVLQP